VEERRVERLTRIARASHPLRTNEFFWKKYVTFRRTYDTLEFDIHFLDGGNGRLPGPTEWDIRIFAKVPVEELPEWINGLNESSTRDVDWVSAIPAAPENLDGFQWYGDAKKRVGINEEEGTVLYRSDSY